MGELLYKQECYAILGAAMRVHATLGCGFDEKVYQEALEIEFRNSEIPFEREKRFLVKYNGHLLSRDYYVDFLCFDKIIVELKAVTEMVGVFEAQVISYLKASDCQLGLLINFGNQSLIYKRLLHSY